MIVQMDVRSVFSTIFRQFWKFMLIAVPIVLVALIYVLTATPVYESRARLLVKFGQDARPDMAISQSGSGLSAEERRGLVQANVNILINRDLAEALMKKVTVEKAYPEIAARIKNPNSALNAAVSQFGQDLKTNTESAAGAIDVSVSHPNPKTANLLLRELLDMYVRRQSEIFGNPQADVIREQADTAYDQLEEANKDLFAYKEKVGVASIDEEITLLLITRSNIADYLSRQEAGGIGSDQQVPSLDMPETGEVITDETISEDVLVEETPGQMGGIAVLPAKKGGGSEIPFPALDEIQRRIDDLRTKELEFLRTYKPSSEIVRNLRENIETETEVLNAAVQALSAKLAELDGRIAQMNQYKAEYDILLRKVKLNEEMYKTAQTRLQAADVNRDLNERKITQISVLEQPSSPERPAQPKKLLTMILAIIVAGALGVATCLISELIDTRFSYPEQLSAHLKEPLLSSFSRKRLTADGSIETSSYWEESLKKYKVAFYKLMKKDLPAEPAMTSGVVEKKILSASSMSRLFQSMSARLSEPGKKIVFVGSSYHGEGVTTVAWELSRYITESIKKDVLFVDYGNAPQGVSLLDVARGKGSLDDALTTLTKGEGKLSVARFADDEERGSTIAYMDELEKVFASLKERFDYVIMPGSNMILDASQVALSKLADGTVFVIEADRTRAPVAKRTLQNLRDSGARIVGLVLNKRFYYIPKWLYSHL